MGYSGRTDAPASASPREVKVEVELENYDDRAVASRGFLPEERICSQRVDVVVDNGAVMLVLPQDLVEALGLRILCKTIVTYADQRKEHRNVAGVVSVRVAAVMLRPTVWLGRLGASRCSAKLCSKRPTC